MDLQAQTLQLYGELLARTPATGWPGKLILSVGNASSGLAAAACIAGAACLVLDEDTQAVRSTFRDGGFDFLVNTLDEALRVLKNEIRQHRPLGVALTAPREAALDEARDRGLYPDLLIGNAELPTRTSLELTEEPSTALTSWLAARNWQITTLAANEPSPAFPPDDPRHVWLRNLPRYQRSATRTPRTLWLPCRNESLIPDS